MSDSRLAHVLHAARTACLGGSFEEALGTVAGALRRAIPACKTLVYAADLRTYRRARPGYFRVEDARRELPPLRLQVDYPLEEMLPYGEHYMQFDPRQAAIARRPGRPLRGSDLIPTARWGRDPLTADYSRRIDARWDLTLGHVLPGGHLLLFALYRGHGRRDFSDRELALLGAASTTIARVATEAVHLGAGPPPGPADEVLAVTFDVRGEPLGVGPGQAPLWERLVPTGGAATLCAMARALAGAAAGSTREVRLRSAAGWAEATLVAAAAGGVRATVRFLAPGTVGHLEAELSASGVTPAEAQVVFLALEGASNAEVARRLGRAANTVKLQLSSALRKLGVSGRAELPLRLLEPGPGGRR